MTWIRTTPPERADAELLGVYEQVYAPYPAEYADPVKAVTGVDGGNDGVVAAHSLIPEAMRFMMSGLAAMMRPHLPLTRRQHEMIATVVSARNSCFY
jgi:hypothetical protein